MFANCCHHHQQKQQQQQQQPELPPPPPPPPPPPQRAPPPTQPSQRRQNNKNVAVPGNFRTKHQRTSSRVDVRPQDARSLFTTLAALLSLLSLPEFFITVDHSSLWKRHLAWAVENGKELRDHMTQRYASSMVFLSLLLTMDVATLCNPANVTTEMRVATITRGYSGWGAPFSRQLLSPCWV